LAEYETKLKEQPVPDMARKYYERDNPFLFELFCTVKSRSLQASDGTTNLYTNRVRPLQLNNLYDVFCNIREDEHEHWKTLCNLVQFNDMNAVDATEVKSTEPIVLVTDEERP
jgi:ubiquinol oxidase